MRRQQTDQQLRERLEAIDGEEKHNREIREQRQLEYQKTIRLLKLIDRSNNERKRLGLVSQSLFEAFSKKFIDNT